MGKAIDWMRSIASGNKARPWATTAWKLLARHIELLEARDLIALQMANVIYNLAQTPIGDSDRFKKLIELQKQYDEVKRRFTPRPRGK